MEYASIYDLKSYVSFFLSKYDKSLTWEKLWYESQSWMISDFSSIIDQGDYNSSYIKLRMGEFDVFFDNGRKWRDWREPTKQVEWMYKMRDSVEYEEMLTNIKIIWNHWDETPITIIYWTVRNWKIIDLRDWNSIIAKTSKSSKRSQELINEFWHTFLPKFKEVSNIYDWRTLNNIRSYDSWLSAKSGIPEIRYVFNISWNYASVELSGAKSKDKTYNKRVFDHFYKNKESIEKKFWDNLIWERMNDKIMSRIGYRLDWVNVYDKNDWDRIMKFLTESMIKLDSALKEDIKTFKK
jgi:hypothetical protein